MIVTTTSLIPNEEIKCIISVVHNRVVLGTNLFSDISASFSDFFGGNNSAYEKRLAEITDDVIDGLKKKALKLRADALIDLKIDVDEVNGKNKSMFMVTAIATAVLFKKEQSTDNEFSLEEIRASILKNRIIKLVEEGKFNPFTDWVSEFIKYNNIIEVFEPFINSIKNSTLDISQSDAQFESYISNLDSSELFDLTFKYFSKEERSLRESGILKIIFKKLVVDYTKILNILSADSPISNNNTSEVIVVGNIDAKRLCLNVLFNTNEIYTDKDFSNIKLILERIKIIFPNLSVIEKGEGMFSKGMKYWRCKCGNKNDSDSTHCVKCHLDEYGNRDFVLNVNKVVEFLEEFVKAIK
jgi:uncharacterized protein YbjQ (UPF0145 family)